jgi:hypothetical protein
MVYASYPLDVSANGGQRYGPTALRPNGATAQERRGQKATRHTALTAVRARHRPPTATLENPTFGLCDLRPPRLSAVCAFRP